MVLICKTLNPPSPKECFGPSFVEIGSVVLEKRILLKFVNVFLLFRKLSSPGKRAWLFNNLNKFESPSPAKDALCQVWLKLALWFLRRLKCEKFTDGRTDDGRVIRKAHLRFQLRWAKNEYYIRVAFCLFIIFGTAKGDPHPFFADHWGEVERLRSSRP